MNTIEFLSSPQVQEMYRKWLNDPMTRIVQELLLQEGRPRTMPFDAIKSEVALELHGESVGWFGCCDRMITLDQTAQPPADIEPTFAPEQPEKEAEPESPKQEG